MELTYRIRPFSCYDNWTVTSETENVSSIDDKLIRLAAKCTDYYAGDIWYDIKTLHLAVEGCCDLKRLLLFRGGGVSAYQLMVEDELYLKDWLPGCTQAWLLTHNPETKETVLKRVICSAQYGFSSHYVGGET